MRLSKYPGNPILTGTGEGDWERIATLNPGAYAENGVVYLFYRASAEEDEYRIYIGLAESRDGFHFERVSDRPILSPGEEQSFDGGCVEDARVVKLDGFYYMTYACRVWPPGLHFSGRVNPNPRWQSLDYLGNISRTALARSKDLRNWEKLGPITRDDVDDRDGILFPEKVGGRYVMLHRPMSWYGDPYPCPVPSIWMTYSDDLLHWYGEHLVAQPVEDWESEKIGGSTPPIATDEGWLTLYHGVGPKASTYRVGVMMLDREEPRKVIARAPDFILEPEADFELHGIVPNVVFPCGNVVLDDELFVYYGGADKVCCVATCKLKDLIDYVMRHRVQASSQ